MAEILGVVASGMGIASLAIQIGDSVMKLRGFWNAVKEAPEEINYLIDEIDTLRQVLSDIGARGSDKDTTQIGSLVSQKCLDLCRRGTELLDTVVREAEHEIAKKRRIGSIKVVFKRGLIDTLRDRLKTVQFMLMLSNQTYSEALQKRRHELQLKWAELHQRELGEVKSALIKTATLISSLEQIDSVPQLSNVESTSGQDLEDTSPGEPEELAVLQGSSSASIERNGRQVENSIKRHKQLISKLRTPAWLSFSGSVWEICCYRARAGWMFTAQTYRVIPDGSQIMDFAWDGNLKGIQELFKMNLASPYDRESDGTTVLDVAALNQQLEVCRFLLNEGADPLVSRKRSAFEELNHGWFIASTHQSKDHEELVRLIMPSSDYDPFTFDYSEPLSLTPPSLEYILKNSDTQYKPLTPQERFAIAIDALSDTYNPKMAQMIRIAVCGNRFDLSMTAYKGERGFMLLHEAATLVGIFQSTCVLDQVKEVYLSKRLISMENSYLLTYLEKFGKIEGEENCLLIQDLVRAGSRICEVSVWGRTPLLAVCMGISYIWDMVSVSIPYIPIRKRWELFSKQGLESSMRSWLEQLVIAGVKLVEYGKKESCLHLRSHVYKEWAFEDEGRVTITVRLISFKYGPLPEDWHFWLTEVMDDSFLEFWEMADHPEKAMPGAWDDYDDQLNDEIWDEGSNDESGGYDNGSCVDEDDCRNEGDKTKNGDDG